jgi:hypothetical protein
VSDRFAPDPARLAQFAERNSHQQESGARLWSGDRDDKFIERDRKIAYTLSGRVINRVRNRGGSIIRRFVVSTNSRLIN